MTGTYRGFTYPATILTPNNLEPVLHLDLVYCCQPWPVSLYAPIGHCKFCGERPTSRSRS